MHCRIERDGACRAARSARPDQVAGGRLAGAAVEAGQITGRALEVAVPHGTMNAAQQAVLSRVTAVAAAKGMQVIVVPIK